MPHQSLKPRPPIAVQVDSPMGSLQPLATDAWLTEVVLAEFAVRAALLIGRDRAVVWDTLSHPRDMAAVRPLVEGRELAIVYSHADWDHVWGTAGLPFVGAAIVGHDACLERFDADVPGTLRAKQAAEPGAWDGVRLVPPNTTFSRQYELDLGSITLLLHRLPGHTRDSIVALVPERGLLLMGDAAETPLPVVPARRALPAWIAELERWAGDDRVRTVVPAHGPIGGTEILVRNIDYLRRLLGGRRFDVDGPLTDFYRTTHDDNLRLCCTS